jgi:hypothetical protein
MENESENLLIETIEHFHREINGLFVVKSFIEEQILITDEQDIVDDFKIAIDLIKYNSFLIASYIDLLTSLLVRASRSYKQNIIFLSSINKRLCLKNSRHNQTNSFFTPRLMEM